MARLSEDELIARHFGPLAGPAGLGLCDDAALLTPEPGSDLVLTVDALVAGIHFFPDDPPGDIAAKALGVNLSDLAAKGADPTGFLLALALPEGWTEAWLAGFCSGLRTIADAFACPLIGGDTVKAAGGLTVSVTAIGQVPQGRMVRRTTARPGDLICVTGSIGDAVLGLVLASGASAPWRDALSEAEAAFLLDRYRRPCPRLAISGLLRDLAHAAMDVSDGLLGDAAKMLRASGVSGRIALDRVPFSAAARSALAAEPSRRDGLVTGGDDYEILFTLPPHRLASLRDGASRIGLPVSVIGEVGEGDGLTVTDGSGVRQLASLSFQHF